MEKDQLMKHYEYHKKLVSNLRVVWDIKDIPPDKFVDPRNPHIVPMVLEEGLWANLHQYYTFAMQWFPQDHPEYYILMERDVAIIDENFEKNIIEYMKEKKVGAAFPWIDSRWTNPTHPFAQQLQGLEAKQWGLPALTVINVEALKYYGQSFVHVPNYWGEIRFPTVLAHAGFQVIANPFTSWRYFSSPPKGPEVKEEDRSMKKEVIKEAFEKGIGAIHPVKDYSLLEYIEGLRNEKKSI
ncbi:MAG: hypothetical protein ACHQEM_12805 [Chitinophagales bacterium]